MKTKPSVVSKKGIQAPSCAALWTPPALEEVSLFAAEYLSNSDGRPAWLKSIDRDPTSVYYRFFYEFARVFRPRVTLEIGTCEGASAAHLAAGNPGGVVITLDVKPEAKRLADALFVPNLVSVTSDSIQALARLRWIPPIDVLFIDGNHTLRDAYGEYLAYRPNVLVGGLIFFDDVAINDEMRRMWEAVADPKRDLPSLHYTGFGVAKKSQEVAPAGLDEVALQDARPDAQGRSGP
jgi:predicted O-methyltransferase YrrM